MHVNGFARLDLGHCFRLAAARGHTLQSVRAGHAEDDGVVGSPARATRRLVDLAYRNRRSTGDGNLSELDVGEESNPAAIRRHEWFTTRSAGEWSYLDITQCPYDQLGIDPVGGGADAIDDAGAIGRDGNVAARALIHSERVRRWCHDGESRQRRRCRRRMP